MKILSIFSNFFQNLDLQAEWKIQEIYYKSLQINWCVWFHLDANFP